MSSHWTDEMNEYAKGVVLFAGIAALCVAILTIGYAVLPVAVEHAGEPRALRTHLAASVFSFEVLVSMGFIWWYGWQRVGSYWREGIRLRDRRLDRSS